MNVFRLSRTCWKDARSLSTARVNVSLSSAFPRGSPFAAEIAPLSRILRSTVKNEGSRFRYKGGSSVPATLMTKKGVQPCKGY
jgi:hypothetical protein